MEENDNLIYPVAFSMSPIELYNGENVYLKMRENEDLRPITILKASPDFLEYWDSSDETIKTIKYPDIEYFKRTEVSLTIYKVLHNTWSKDGIQCLVDFEYNKFMTNDMYSKYYDTLTVIGSIDELAKNINYRV